MSSASTPLTTPTFRPYPAHMSFSQSNALADCGERFRLERGFGLRGTHSWALVGGKAFHFATELLDIALERIKFGVAASALSAPPAAPGVASSESSQVGPVGGSPGNEQLSEKSQLISDLVTAQSASRTLLDELAVVIAGSPVQPEAISEMWRTALRHEINDQLLSEVKALQNSPDTGPVVLPTTAGWRAAGRATKEWPDKEDERWWLEMGAPMLTNYIKWRMTSGWQLAYLGLPGQLAQAAIETDLSTLVGDVQVIGYMDRAFLNPQLGGAPTICDLKTSKTLPTSSEQLCLYATLLEILGYPRAPYGTYYMARTGEMSQPYDLSAFGIDYFRWKLSAARDLRDSGRLQPNTSSMWCRGCGVAEYCFAVGGQRAHEIPRPWAATAAPSS